jgi:hypothetical protein
VYIQIPLTLILGASFGSDIAENGLSHLVTKVLAVESLFEIARDSLASDVFSMSCRRGSRERIVSVVFVFGGIEASPGDGNNVSKGSKMRLSCQSQPLSRCRLLAAMGNMGGILGIASLCSHSPNVVVSLLCDSFCFGGMPFRYFRLSMLPAPKGSPQQTSPLIPLFQSTLWTMQFRFRVDFAGRCQ